MNERDIAIKAREPVGTLVRFHGIHRTSELFKLDVEESWFGETVDFANIELLADLPSKRYKEGDFWPLPVEDSNTWRRCTQNPWTVETHPGIDLSFNAITRFLPDCLVFNTTVARLFVTLPGS